MKNEELRRVRPPHILHSSFFILHSKFNFPLLVALFIFAALRAPLFAPAALPLGWNSDAAIFGLMAKAMFEHHAFPIYFFGQSYMGPLTSWTAVLVALFTGTVGPFELRLGVAIMNAAALVFWWLALRRTFDVRAAAMATLWMAIGPDYVMRFVIAPIGAEQLFFMSAVLFWYGTRLPFRWFVFGILSGFGWWIHQGVVFVIAAVIAVAILRSEWWSRVAPELRIRDRLNLRAYDFGVAARIGIHALQLLISFDLLLGILQEFGFGAPAFFLFHPIAEPLAALVLLHAIIVVVADRASLKRAFAGTPRRPALRFAGGALIGYAPVIIGGLLHVYPDRYTADAALLSLSDLVPHLRETVPDVVPFLDNTIVAIVLIPAFVVAVVRFRGESATRLIALATILFAFTFYFVSLRAHEGQMRYIVAALPLVYAFAAEQLARSRILAVAATVVVAAGLLVPRIEQVRAVTNAQYEAYNVLIGNVDPRPVLRTIEANGYRVCTADYWLAYKLEWLSGGKVQFITHPGYDRLPERTRRLKAIAGPVCFVDGEGSVTRQSRSH